MIRIRREDQYNLEEGIGENYTTSAPAFFRVQPKRRPRPISCNLMGKSELRFICTVQRFRIP